MKLKTIYICQKCGGKTSKWSGQCLQCNSWNSFVEDVEDVSQKKQSIRMARPIKPTVIIDNIQVKNKRLLTKISELDRVLGGGFMPDSLTLLAGDPGIGKSTLTLQICDKMADLGKKVLYISGEESTDQISGRANRLDIKSNIQLLNLNDLETILATIEAENPGFAVIDSVQVMASMEIASQAGSISQVRYVTEQLMRMAKTKNIPILLIGHVNKDGNLAGPQVLTHLVDTVLFLEGDEFHEFRILKSTKNRFGAVDEAGIFKMDTKGLIEVQNPSALFLEGRATNPIGSVIVPILEGTRTFLVEVQALTSHTHFGYPKRTASGIDLNRLNIIIAVLERYANIKLENSDVFVNVVGGLKLREPGIDLAVAMAIASSKLQKPLPSDLAVMGEIGLSGEVRAITQSEKREKEAKKLGFKQILSVKQVKSVAEGVKKSLQPKY